MKALASPREAALLDKVFTTSATSIANKDKRLNKRSSLRNRMLAEDDAKAGVVNSQKVEETTSNAEAVKKPSLAQSVGQNAIDSPDVLVHTPVACRSSSCKTSAGGALAIVPSKKKGGFDLLRKLLLRRKKGHSQKSRFSAKV
ncbi:hypothetical protein TorRG33x02_221520 [Trema orientale]|uniref:Uncharacterized protein n=1 Tax=Trema orientale TaxID=63057 RepID=A0A2P5E912_TREOI|nr:hypothetical protein TorRG33x02_221520 [Trema orientale]